MPQNENNKGERIAKLLARAGIASRREVERMIGEHRVKLNGTVLTTPATILIDLRGVMVDDKPVAAPEPTRLFAFHKPPGLITAERDPAGRPTIYNALRNALPPGTPRLMPVGRLDFTTEGLLLLTNDGAFKRALELPATGVPRTYRARAFGQISQAQLEALSEGVTIDDMHYGRIIADMERRTGTNGWVVMTLTEGKNREVRRVLEHLGLEVNRLIRTAYGPFHLGELPRGSAVEIRPADVERFANSLSDASFGALRPVAMKAADRPISVAVRPPVEPKDRRGAGRIAAKPTGKPLSKPAPRSLAKPAPKADSKPAGAKRQAPRKPDMDDDGRNWQSGGRRNAPGPRRGDEKDKPRGAPPRAPASGSGSSRSGSSRGAPPRTGPARPSRGKR